MPRYLLLVMCLSFFSFANVTPQVTYNDKQPLVVEYADDKEEIVKDKLGRISVFVYDDEGNVLS